MAEETGIHEAAVKHQGTKEKISKTFDFKATIAEAIEAFGEAAVYYNYIVGARTALRNKLYSLCHGKDEEALPTAEGVMESVRDWVPSVGSERATKDHQAVAMAAFGSMTSEQRTAFIAGLKTIKASAE